MSKKKSYEVKRTYKDSIFRSLFNDEETLRELYGALSDRELDESESIEIVTLANDIFNELQDDLAFTVGALFIVLVEHQSTDCPNMPVRMLQYIAEQYRQIIDEKALHGTAPVEIPTPELYVFYNGSDDKEEEWIQNLSDLFKTETETPAIEVKVKVININYEKGHELLQKCRTLEGYSILIHKVNMYIVEYIAKNGSDLSQDKQNYREALDAAMKRAIDECIREEILVEYLTKNRGSVMRKLRRKLTEKQKREIYERDAYYKFHDKLIAEGRAEERLKAEQEKLEHIIALKNVGVEVEQLAEIFGMTNTEIENIVA